MMIRASACVVLLLCLAGCRNTVPPVTPPCDGGLASCASTLSECLDEKTLQTLEPQESCGTNGCKTFYTAEVTTCPHGCAAGACKTDPCVGVVCVDVPKWTCLDDHTVRFPRGAGFCVAGQCAYPTEDLPCAFGCQNNACNPDPCDTVTCVAPEPMCEGLKTVRSFSPKGVCTAGHCSFDSTLTTCVGLCRDGRCIGDACSAVVCATPPANYCANASTRTAFNPQGTCDRGTCSYSAASTACAALETCAAGSCRWNDAKLESLTVSPGSFNFIPEREHYVVTVPAVTTHVTMNPSLPPLARATFTVDGSSAFSGHAVVIPLLNGAGSSTIVVTAESGTKKTYALNVVSSPGVHAQTEYFKASNADAAHRFGWSMAMSADGSTLAVGAPAEGSSAKGINGPQGDMGAPYSGAAYVFSRTSAGWVQQAYVKPSNTAPYMRFGWALALSGDGRRLAISATDERSDADTVNGDQTNVSANSAGAVYVFSRTGTTWSQEAYLKASNSDELDRFGWSLALSLDGQTIAVGARDEGSAAVGINGNAFDNTQGYSGAAYVFTRSGGSWSQEAYVKSSNSEALDFFGVSVALSSDGNTLAVGADGEDGNGTGTTGNPTNNTLSRSGAVYVFRRVGVTWSQSAYVKSSNSLAQAGLGRAVSLSSDGTRLAASAPNEESSAGAAYLFDLVAGVWLQQARLKASNSGAYDYFGTSLAISADGDSLVVGAPREASQATGSNSTQTDNSTPGSGAAYVFARSAGQWLQRSYLKASNSAQEDEFACAVALSGDGDSLVVGAHDEDSKATGVNGAQSDNSASESGAVYVFSK